MADDIPTMNTGDVNRRLGGIAVTGEHLTALGFTPTETHTTTPGLLWLTISGT